ncbi:DUF934 domain-containing protein [Hansschlegelia sp.]|uniref:DUF934 domain-containing protein n=1 Tax=Hansschlegelia sp. TaxID=2041892 RepID=UPI002C58E3B6|nr:DUF934 domain-containing protein [Hansschlegelia sp.]HVI27111.1 DUF934 domain-containing protein [Hansschlegelia sp.]
MNALARLPAEPADALPAGTDQAQSHGPALWRNGRFEADEWARAPEGEAVPEGPALLPLVRFLAERDALSARNAPLGVVIQPNEAVEELAPHLDRVSLVALVFPKFADGRASSMARLLRERYGFTGELRATGDVLIDQMPLMQRCGFDAFEVVNEPTRRQLAAGKWPDVPYYLQPTGAPAQLEVPAGTRPWARRPA